jgi:tetratricopeptide (TPR) repeat protein
MESKHDYKSAIAVVDSLLGQDSTIAFLHYRKARLRLAAGDTNAGITSLKKALAHAPDNGDVLLELGYILADRKNAEALTIADTIVAVSKDADMRSKARLLKGIYFSNKGDKAAALKEYDASIIDNYTFLDAFIEKAIVQYEMKKYADAMVTLDKAQAIRPAEAEIYLWKGKCNQAAGQLDEAMDNYRKCLGLDASMKEAADLLAGLEARK